MANACQYFFIFDHLFTLLPYQKAICHTGADSNRFAFGR